MTPRCCWFWALNDTNFRTVTLLCRPSHEVHLGRQPHYIPDYHPEKAKMVRIAEIARRWELIGR